MLTVEYVLEMMKNHPLFAYDDLVCRLCDNFGLCLDECELMVDDAVAVAIDRGWL